MLVPVSCLLSHYRKVVVGSGDILLKKLVAKEATIWTKEDRMGVEEKKGERAWRMEGKK